MTAILICCMFARLMTYIPRSDDNAVILMISAVISGGLQLVLLLPAVMLYKKSGGGAVGQGLSRKGMAGKAFSAVYLAFCVFALVMTLGNFIYFLQYGFSEYYSTAAVLAVVAAASVYVASMGLSACARTAVITAFITVIGILMVFTGFNRNIDPLALNIACENKAGLLLRGIRNSLSRCEEIIFFVLLLPKLKDKPMRTACVYTASRAFIIASVVAVGEITLGDYAKTSRLPFFSLSLYSKTGIIERYDAFFLMFWALCAIIKAAVAVLCTVECLKSLFPKSRISVWRGVCAVLCALIAYYPLSKGKWEPRFYEKWEYIVMILLTAVLPLAVMLICRSGRAEKREAAR